MLNQPTDAVIRKIEALLNTNGCTEAEAEARMAKAQELLERHNLDMANIGGKSDARKDQVRKGGLYTWQRRLWAAVAELNFCHYLSIKGLARGSAYEHRIIGSHANVVSTEVMAKYLQETIEKLAQQWSRDTGYHSVFVREAIAYREGMTSRISERLRERRNQIVSEARKAEQERKQAQAQANAQSTSHALTILDVISTEQDLNNDYLNGWELGTTARNRAENEARHAAWKRDYDAKRAAMTDAEKAAEKKALEDWLAEQAKKDAKRAKRRSKEPVYRTRRATPEEERMSLGSYYEGRRKGAEVGIDQQVDKRSGGLIR